MFVAVAGTSLATAAVAVAVAIYVYVSSSMVTKIAQKKKPVGMIQVRREKAHTHTHAYCPIMANIRPDISGYCLHEYVCALACLPACLPVYRLHEIWKTVPRSVRVTLASYLALFFGVP